MILVGFQSFPFPVITRAIKVYSNVFYHQTELLVFFECFNLKNIKPNKEENTYV